MSKKFAPCYLELPIRGKSSLFGDQKTVVNSLTLPHGELHKKHITLSHHRVREAIAFKMIVSLLLDEGYDLADILSWHWGYQAVWKSLRTLLFLKGNT